MLRYPWPPVWRVERVNWIGAGFFRVVAAHERDVDQAVAGAAVGFGELEDAFAGLGRVLCRVPALAHGRAGFADEAGQLRIVFENITRGFDCVADCEKIQRVPSELFLALQIKFARVVVG